MNPARFLFAVSVPCALLFAVACGGDDGDTDQTGPAAAGSSGKAGGAGKGGSGTAGKGGSGTAGTGGSETAGTGGSSGKGGGAGKGGAAGKGGEAGEGGSDAGGRAGSAGETAAGSGGAAAGSGGAAAGSGGAAAGTGGTGGAATCHGTALGDDDRRWVVVAHPFADPSSGSTKGDKYEVLALSGTGVLSKTGQTFAMGNADGSPIVFTPDGQLGFVVQDNGKIGAFRVDDDGKVTVIDKAFDVGGSAEQLVMDPGGERLFVVSFNTTANGGGIYEASIACDGKLTAKGKILAGDVPSTMDFVPNQPGIVAVAARGLGDSKAGENIHLVDLSKSPPVRLASAAGFPDAESHAPSLAIMPDAKAIIVVDNSFTAGNRAAVVRLDGTALAPTGVVKFNGAAWVVPSPFGQLALGLALDGGADGYYTFAYTAGAAEPFAAPKKISVSPKAQLPDTAVVFKRGVRKGLVLASEVEGVRTMRLAEDGTIADGGLLLTTDGTGDDLAGIAGPLGFAPLSPAVTAALSPRAPPPIHARTAR